MNYFRIAGIIGTTLSFSNIVSVFVPRNQYVGEDALPSYWIRMNKLDTTKAPLQLFHKTCLYALHTIAIFSISTVKGMGFGLIWPITAADFIYEYKYDRNWRKYYNLGYMDSPYRRKNFPRI